MLWGSFNGYKVALVQSLEDLAFIRSNLYANILVGCDSETTGLSFVSDYVVGVCLSTVITFRFVIMVILATCPLRRLWSSFSLLLITT